MATTGTDFTSGATLKQLVTFSGPIMFANLLQASYQLVDNLWVGNLLGAQALGAVAISSALIFTVLSFVIGMNNAALAILSQQRGRRDEEGLKRYLNAFIVILFAGSLALGAAGFFLSDLLLQAMGTPVEILTWAREYLQITFLGMLFLFGYNFISTVLRAMGDSKTPMRFVALAVILNAALDPLFIYTFGLGIRGAAFATVVSQGVAFVYGVVHILRRRLVPIQAPHLPSGSELRTILGLGIPAGLQMAVISAGAAAVMSVVASFGPDVTGGFGAAQRLDSLIMLPAQALGISVSSMAGQNIGGRNWKRVGEIARVAVLYNLAIMITIAVVVIVIADGAIALFVGDGAAADFGARYVRVVALCYPFLGINFVLNGIVRASGAMYQVLALNIVSFWVLRYPLTAVFSQRLGEIGIGFGMGASFIVSSAAAFLYFRFGKWRDKQLFEEPVRG